MINNDLDPQARELRNTLFNSARVDPDPTIHNVHDIALNLVRLQQLTARIAPAWRTEFQSFSSHYGLISRDLDLIPSYLFGDHSDPDTLRQLNLFFISTGTMVAPSQIDARQTFEFLSSNTAQVDQL